MQILELIQNNYLITKSMSGKDEVNNAQPATEHLNLKVKSQVKY